MFAQVLCVQAWQNSAQEIFYPIWDTYFRMMIQVTFGFLGWVGKYRGSGGKVGKKNE